MRISRRLSAALTLTAALALTPAASAEAAKLKLGVYDCHAYDYYSGFLLYKGSVKLMSGGKYQHAWGRKKAKFEDPTKGSYKIKGKKVKFRGGAMQHTPGRVTKRTSFDVWVDGEASGISCSFIKKP